MSGHSKWSKIQHKKGVLDAKRGTIFTKLGKAITLAVQQGGGDSEMNFTLRLAIEKAKQSNMPKDNIDRAIKKGTGELKDSNKIEEIIYEGFGSNGVAILIEALTDNRNRTVSEIKHILNKYGGSLGGPNSVQWQFEQKGVISLTPEKKQEINDWENVQLELMDNGVEDIKETEDGVELISTKENFKKMLDAFSKLNIEPDDSGLEWLPKEALELDEEANKKLVALENDLEELDDVKQVYTNGF